MVYNDLNGDGSNDGGTDPGLAGWTINVLDSSNNIVATTTSAADGTYSFTDLPVQAVHDPGGHSSPAGSSPSRPTRREPTRFPAAERRLHGPRLRQLPARERLRQRLQRPQRQRQPGSGRAGPGGLDRERGRCRATTWSPRPSPTPAGTTRSRTSAPARSPSHEVVQAGWIITQPTNPSYYSFTSTSGVNVVGGIFGNFHTITVSGNVYNDLNGNGLQERGEPGLQGWTVDLEDCSGNILATVLTDASGNYAFTGVGAGIYQVAQVVQTNWVQTQPLYPTVYSFTTQSGHNLNALIFGDHASPALNPVRRDRQRPGRLLRDRHVEHGGRRVQRHQPGRPDRRTAAATRPRRPGPSPAVGQHSATTSTSPTAASRSTRRPHRSPCTTAARAWAPRTSTSRSWSPSPRAAGPRAATAGSAGSSWATSRSPAASSRSCSATLPPGNFVDADGVLLIVAHGGGSPVQWARRPAPPTASGRLDRHARPERLDRPGLAADVDHDHDPEGDHAHRREPAVLAARGVQPGQPGEQQPRTAA